MLSLEIDPARTALARENVERAGVGDAVELRTGDAGAALRSFEDGEWELVFLDAERDAYVGYWPDLSRVLAPGALLVVDNAISHSHELVEFDSLVRRDAGFVTSLVPSGAGALLAVKSSASRASSR